MKVAARFWVAGILGGLCGFGCDQPGKESVEVPEKQQVQAKTSVAPEPKSDEMEPPAQPKADSLRFILLAEQEPLGSELVQLKSLREKLSSSGFLVEDKPPTKAEETFLRATLKNPDAPPELPTSFRQFETVFVLGMALPQGKEAGKRVSRGRSHLLLIHPPEPAPAFSTVYEEEGGAYLEGAKLGVWVKTHVKYRKEGEK
jgi:hypothetical protein